MAESEIPEDIRTKALAVSLCHQEPRGCVHPDDNSCEDGCELYEAIAKALLSERERCAVLAEGYNFPGLGEKLGTSSDIINSTALEIAAAIRKDNPNETEQGNG